MNEIISLIKQLIKNKNTSPESINQSMNYCANWLKANGVNVSVLENMGLKMVVASVGEKNPTIILNGHIDVVPGEPEDFIPRIAENRIYGRGSFDMLGSVAVMMKLMKELSKTKIDCKVMLVLVPDEEQGGNLGTKHLVENGYIGDMVICGEPTNLDIAIQAKGFIQLEIEIRGIAAHGSRPWLGKNAILMAVDSYKKLEKANMLVEKTEFFDRPSFNLAKIKGGTVMNQVPSSCQLGVDIRYLPGQKPMDFISKINNIDPTAKIKVISEGVPVETDKNNKFVKQLYEITKSIKGNETKFFGQQGSADTRYYAKYGIPAVEFGPVGANHHASNEFVDITSLEKYKAILKKYIQSIKKTIQGSVGNETEK